MAISKVHYYLLLAHLPSLWFIAIFYWPSKPPYGMLLSSTGPLALPIVHYYLLLANWLSLWYTTFFY